MITGKSGRVMKLLEHDLAPHVGQRHVQQHGVGLEFRDEAKRIRPGHGDPSGIPDSASSSPSIATICGSSSTTSTRAIGIGGDWMDRSYSCRPDTGSRGFPDSGSPNL